MDKINITNPTPEIGPYTKLTPFRFWCQKVLPLVYDESLSYYELLCKVVDYLNKTMEDVDNMIDDMGEFRDAYADFTGQVKDAVEELEGFVNNYFDNLDVQEEINNKLDAMAEAGYFSTLFTTLFTADIITEAGNVTSAWIAENLLQETGYVIDNSLTVANAAADAKAAGDRISALETETEALKDPEDKANGEKYRYIYTDAHPVNLVNYMRLIHGYYVNNGNIIAGADWNITEKIPVTPGDTLALYKMQITCFFEEDGTFISQVVGVGSATVPADSAYCISCVSDANKTDCYITSRSGQDGSTMDKGFFVNNKKDYEPGFISFTVPVRQTKSNNSVDSTSLSEGTEDYVNVDCILSLPVTYTAVGKPTKLLMMCHGAGQGVNSWKENESYQALVNNFLGRKYAIFDCNGFKNDALGWSFWGDPRGVECWYKAYQYVVDNYNVEPEFSIYAFSMGGLTALNLAMNGFPNIKCIAMGSPVVSLEACYNDEGVHSVIQLLYGMGDTFDPTKCYGSDPYSRIIEIDNKNYIFSKMPPLKIWYGSTETTGAVNKQLAIDFIEALNNAGAKAEYREVAGAGHEICYGGNSVVNNDYLVYFERYDKYLALNI